MDLFRKTFVEVSLSALKHNLKQLKRIVDQDQFFCPMIKSNAYGHGDYDVARALTDEGVRDLGVALVEEGMALRFEGYDQVNIFVFGIFDGIGAKNIIENKLTPVISQLGQLKYLEELLPVKANYPVHFKINTGMNRLGFSLEDGAEAFKYIKNSTDSKIRITGICTHLSDGGDAGMDSKRTSKQFECFTKMTQLMKQDSILQHVYNSAGLLSSWVRNEPIRFGCRPGLSLYGVYPEILDLDQSQIKQIQSLDLRPVMTLKSEVIMFNKVKTGERVSYGGTWEARRDSIVGVVPIGYADGFFRSFSNCGVVLYRGKRAPVVGTVCMDYTLIDLTDILKGENGIVGEPVTLFGDQKGERLSIDEVAKIGNTIPYEIMTAIGRRVPRKSI